MGCQALRHLAEQIVESGDAGFPGPDSNATAHGPLNEAANASSIPLTPVPTPAPTLNIPPTSTTPPSSQVPSTTTPPTTTAPSPSPTTTTPTPSTPTITTPAPSVPTTTAPSSSVPPTAAPPSNPPAGAPPSEAPRPTPSLTSTPATTAPFVPPPPIVTQTTSPSPSQAWTAPPPAQVSPPSDPTLQANSVSFLTTVPPPSVEPTTPSPTEPCNLTMASGAGSQDAETTTNKASFASAAGQTVSSFTPSTTPSETPKLGKLAKPAPTNATAVPVSCEDASAVVSTTAPPQPLALGTPSPTTKSPNTGASNLAGTSSSTGKSNTLAYSMFGLAACLGVVLAIVLVVMYRRRRRYLAARAQGEDREVGDCSEKDPSPQHDKFANFDDTTPLAAVLSPMPQNMRYI